MTYTKLLSPNFDDRKDSVQPSLIILHYTGTKTDREAEETYLTAGKVSPHYMIYGDGSVVQFVDETKRAWHAGKARWGRLDDINSASIGIEIWNTGHEHDLEDFASVQIQSLIDLVGGIKQRHNIADYNILGHSDVAPGRKVDPGEKFPWGALASAGLGIMPKVNEEDELLAAHWMDQHELILSALKEYGYDPDIDPAILLREFRRHFLPAYFEDWGADILTCAALASLLRQKRRIEFQRKHQAAV